MGLVLAALAVAGLAIVMVRSRWRERLVGDSPLANAAVVLAPAALVAGALALPRSPGDGASDAGTLTIFVENVSFGLPAIAWSE